MKKEDVIKRLDELNKKGCQSVWFILKNGHHQGAKFNEIINDTLSESISLKQIDIYMTINYTELENIIDIY